MTTSKVSSEVELAQRDVVTRGLIKKIIKMTDKLISPTPHSPTETQIRAALEYNRKLKEADND